MVLHSQLTWLELCELANKHLMEGRRMARRNRPCLILPVTFSDRQFPLPMVPITGNAANSVTYAELTGFLGMRGC
jgi:hypothetical protein